MTPATTAVVPRATYRLQLHRGFDFEAACAVLPYLQRLGISHVYCSPIATARAGSLHGYDATDPTQINPELGGRAGFERFATAARAHGIGLLLDIVPNHMAVFSAGNAWWAGVLENGPASPFADFFDIEWHPANPALDGKLLLPVLGDPYGEVLERGEIRLVRDAACGRLQFGYHEHRFPLDPKSYGSVLADTSAEALRILAVAFEQLPDRNDDDPAARELRASTQREMQARLARACLQPEAAAALDARIAAMNSPDARDALDALHNAQVFRLAYWRSAAHDINYRRFFDVNDLAALRVEDERVFEATHGLALDLAAAGWIDGLRIDHPDGLLDPAEYFMRLQLGFLRRCGRSPDEAAARPLYVVAEKIVADHEDVPAAWALHGTTGYRFAMLVNGLFVERRNGPAMERTWRNFSGVSSGFEAIVHDAKRHAARELLSAPLTELAHALQRIALADRRTRDHAFESLRDALAEVAAAMPVYRTYVGPSEPASAQDRRFIDWAVKRAQRPGDTIDSALFGFVRRCLLGEAPPELPALAGPVRRFAMRFQQFTSPVAAKGVEDTAFYRYHRLASLNEVGGEPSVFGISASAFHGASTSRGRDWPHTMLATSTHDNKRAEDVRSRIDVLSEQPAAWRLAMRRWRTATRGWRTPAGDVEWPTPADQYLLHQTLLGTLPAEGLTSETLADYRERIEQYLLKAAREAKLHTAWARLNPAYEVALVGFVRGLLGRIEGNPVLAELQGRAAELARFGALNSLSMTLLKFTSPGVPDLYQGTELVDLSLVDPDNRRAVDYARRDELLASFEAAAATGDDLRPYVARLGAVPTDGALKLWLVWRLLSLRAAHPGLFESGRYVPLRVTGARRRHVIAYARRGREATLIVIGSRKFVGLAAAPGQLPLGTAVWSDTQVQRPPWLQGTVDSTEVLTGAHTPLEAGSIELASVFGVLPMVALWVPHAPATDPAPR